LAKDNHVCEGEILGEEVYTLDTQGGFLLLCNVFKKGARQLFEQCAASDELVDGWAFGFRLKCYGIVTTI
jgi:hypothetical protein